MNNTDHLYFGIGADLDSAEPINFLETRFQDLSPFSAHEVMVDGIVYKTAEHAYQALRVVPEAREAIMRASYPMDAWREGQQCKERKKLLPDVDKDALMEKIFRAKLVQHPDIQTILRVTQDRQLLKVYDSDYYWGTGADGTGENRMGKIWMKLREEL